jgi:hypothetical protein
MKLKRGIHADSAAAPECRAFYKELLARERSDLRRMRVHSLTIDTWTVQHPGQPSAESVRAVGVHLVSLYSQWVLGLSYRAAKLIRREAAETIDFRWLPPPEPPGELTVEHALGAQTPEQHIERVRQWAGSTWRAWHPHHDQVMSWARRIFGQGRVAEPPPQGELGWYAGARNAVHPAAHTPPPTE